MSNITISIYLAGNIQKGHEQESEIFWTEKDQAILRDGIAPNEIIFLNPATRSDDLTDQKSVFGRDMTQVFFADVVMVDARERRGLGVGAEMMWAKVNHIPVITLAPKNSHYLKKEVNLLGASVQNWTHPFVYSLSDLIINDLQKATRWLHQFIQGDLIIKDRSSIVEAMRYYQNNQLQKDLPMRELIQNNPRLQEKVEKFQELAKSP